MRKLVFILFCSFFFTVAELVGKEFRVIEVYASENEIRVKIDGGSENNIETNFTGRIYYIKKGKVNWPIAEFTVVNVMAKEAILKIKGKPTEDIESGHFLEFYAKLKGTLIVRTKPEEATVKLNNGMEGKTPWAVKLTPGNYQMTISHADYRTETYDISVRSGEITARPPYELTSLKNEYPSSRIDEKSSQSETKLQDQTSTQSSSKTIVQPPKQLSQSFLISINSIPEKAAVYLDNRKIGETPLRQEISKAQGVLRIEKDDYETQHEILNLIQSPFEKVYILTRNIFDLWVYTNPKETLVTVMGQQYASGVPIKIKGGDYKIRVEKQGFKPVAKEIKVDYKDVHTEVITLEELGKGRIRLYSNPHSIVEVDGESLGEIPPERTTEPLIEGPHRVTFFFPNIGLREERDIEVKANVTIYFMFKLEDELKSKYELFTPYKQLDVDIDGMYKFSIPPQKTFPIKGGPHSLTYSIREKNEDFIVLKINDRIEDFMKKNITINLEPIDQVNLKKSDLLIEFPEGSGNDCFLITSNVPLQFALEDSARKEILSAQPLKFEIEPQRTYNITLDLTSPAQNYQTSILFKQSLKNRFFKITVKTRLAAIR